MYNKGHELLDNIIKQIDPDPEVGSYIAHYILTNSDKVNTFLEKHDLENVLFFPIGTLFYLTNLTDYSRKETQRFKDNKFQIKYMKQNITLMQLNADEELKELLKIDQAMIESLVSRNQELLDLPKPKRYNDKSIIKNKLENVFFYLEKEGLGQTEQINIILDLFEQESFEDYAGGWTQERFDRIRKGYQEPAINKFKKIYGK